MEIQKTVSNARKAFFLFAALAFIGLGVYMMGHKVPGVFILVIGVGGFMIALSVIKFSYKVLVSIRQKENKQKAKRK